MKYNIVPNIENSVSYASGKHAGKQVKRERYSNMIGYDFGGYVYLGAAYTDNARQYLFESIKDKSVWVTDYKGFREHIDKYDFPGRILKSRA
ncbi:hypothetical protein ABER99_20215 [Paenibacillus glucanolyticus]|jgi:hypothetical protein|uniref:Uncharacterized protein n=1 Tax=Paenibacillus glucanolyticus TaxID=59843 RepID=A0A163GKT0_9BACL|nr:hypothetical protein [Paenibacillus glucanolyticus]KZS45025.1 hypothetical protein AWU65_03320 [Paenibacillus glucanolyticus]OMF66738.1 hypothetical protein BK142_29395 [Paenibacillus glucanolyticus]